MASAKSRKAATCTVRMELDQVTFTSPKFWNFIPIAFRANRQNIMQVKYCLFTAITIILFRTFIFLRFFTVQYLSCKLQKKNQTQWDMYIYILPFSLVATNKERSRN